MASLRELRNGRWQLVLFVGRDATGKQQRVTKVIHARTATEARRQMAKVEVALQKRAPTRSHAGRTLGQLIDDWHAHRKAQPGASPYTISRQRGMLNVIIDKIGKLRLDDLKPQQIDAFYAALRAKGLSESTVHHYHRLLGAAIRQGHKWGVVDAAVMGRVTPPAPRRPVIVPPSSDAVLGVLAKASGDLSVVLRLYAATGARRSELLGAQWGDLVDGVLTLRRAVVEIPDRPVFVKEWLKNPDEPPRRVPLDAGTVAMLDDYRARLATSLADLGGELADDVFVFPDLRADPTGRTPRRPDAITAQFRKACQAAKVRMRLHDLRHWHATSLIDAGVPVTDVSSRLGHSLTSTTLNIYAHAVERVDDRSAKVIGAALDNAESPRPKPGASGRPVKKGGAGARRDVPAAPPGRAVRRRRPGPAE
jgi:integrase